MKPIIILLIPILLIGCRFLPAKHTYFEAIQSGGRPISTMTCDYASIKKNTLIESVRVEDDKGKLTNALTIELTPYYDMGKNPYVRNSNNYLSAFIMVSSERTAVDTNKILISINSQDKTYPPVFGKISLNTSSTSNSAFITNPKKVYLVYPVDATEIYTVKFIFEPGWMFSNKQLINFDPFDFIKVDNTYIYDNSDNCKYN